MGFNRDDWDFICFDMVLYGGLIDYLLGLLQMVVLWDLANLMGFSRIYLLVNVYIGLIGHGHIGGIR